MSMYRTDRYTPEYFDVVQAHNEALAAAKAQAKAVPSLPTQVPGLQPLVAAGHIVATYGDLIATPQHPDLFIEATYEVAPDSPIFKRVVGYAQEILKIYRAYPVPDTGYTLIRTLQEFIGRFCEPLGGDRTQQAIMDLASEMDEQGHRVKACEVHTAHLIA